MVDSQKVILRQSYHSILLIYQDGSSFMPPKRLPMKKKSKTLIILEIYSLIIFAIFQISELIKLKL